MEEIRQRIKNEAQEIEQECSLLCMDHYHAAGRWDRVNLWLGLPATVIAGITSVTALSDIAGANKDVVTGVLAIIVAALSALTTFLNPSEKASSHKSASSSYEALRVKTSLLKDIDLSVDFATLDDYTKEIVKQLKDLAAQFTALSQSSLRVPRSIHQKQRRNIPLQQP
jgi:hypothetical protein